MKNFVTLPVDLKAKTEHLWITFVDAENTGVFKFHMLASDLINNLERK